MIYGYARVSTEKQKLGLQIDALKKAGCEIIVEEKASVLDERPKLDKLLEKLKKGDTLIVWRLDRLGREIFSLFSMIIELDKKGVSFEAINEKIDTKTAFGKVMIALSAFLAEMEREILKERRDAGLKRSRANGKKGGRPKGLSKENRNKAPNLIRMYKEVKDGILRYSIKEILEGTQTNRTTFYKILREYDVELEREKLFNLQPLP